MFTLKRLIADYNQLGYLPGQFNTNPGNQQNLVLIAKKYSPGQIIRIEVDDDDGAVWATDSVNKPLGIANLESGAEDTVVPGELINRPDGTVNFPIDTEGQFALILNPTGTILIDNEVLNYRFYLKTDEGGYIERGQINITDTSDFLTTPAQFLDKLDVISRDIYYATDAPFRINILSAIKIGPTLSKVEVAQNLYANKSKPVEIARKSMRYACSSGTREFFSKLCEKFIAYPDGTYWIPEPEKYEEIAKYRQLKDLLLDNLVGTSLWRCTNPNWSQIDLHIIGRQALIKLRAGTAEVTLGNYYCLSTFIPLH